MSEDMAGRLGFSIEVTDGIGEGLVLYNLNY